MRVLILAAGRFEDQRHVTDGPPEPRLDVHEIASRLDADVMDFSHVQQRLGSFEPPKIATKLAPLSAGVAALGFAARDRYDAILTTGEDIGLPLAAMLRLSSSPVSHTMIAHTLFPRKKRIFFTGPLSVASRLDRVLAYSSTEERLMLDTLGFRPDQVRRISYHADTEYFAPDPSIAVEPDLICAAGQLLRDYDCLIEAVENLPVRARIAAGSPWIARGLAPSRPLPDNVGWQKLNRYDLRDLYARSAIAVVPIKQNEYQTGIATILEMMAMGKCVIATRTHGQTDTIVDGETGIYVPPGDPTALREAIQAMLAAPERARRIGAAAREHVVTKASLDLFVETIAAEVRAGYEVRANRQASANLS